MIVCSVERWGNLRKWVRRGGSSTRGSEIEPWDKYVQRLAARFRDTLENDLKAKLRARKFRADMVKHGAQRLMDVDALDKLMLKQGQQIEMDILLSALNAVHLEEAIASIEVKVG